MRPKEMPLTGNVRKVHQLWQQDGRDNWYPMRDCEYEEDEYDRALRAASYYHCQHGKKGKIRLVTVEIRTLNVL